MPRGGSNGRGRTRSPPVISTIHRLAWPGAVLLAWLLAWWHLAAEWKVEEQYRYGFGVPFSQHGWHGGGSRDY